MVGDDHTVPAGGGGGGYGGQATDQDIVGAGGAGTIDDNAITSLKTLINAPGPNGVRTATPRVPLSIPGGDGGDSNGDSSRDGGAGGNSFFGQGGDGGDYSPNVAAQSGTGIGAGGGGGRGQANATGGNGTEGLVVISYSQDGAPS